MNLFNHSFTSESVSAGHPDKVADQISDAILDAYLAQDPDAKVACECLITTNHLTIAGEVTSSAIVDPIAIAKQVLERIGYNDSATGFNWETAFYQNLLHQQSKEINDSVIDGGAGDQGLMFGYATSEGPNLMPLPIYLAHELIRKHQELRDTGNYPFLLPDAKSQVTVDYKLNSPIGVSKVVFSAQHTPDITQEFLHEFIIREIINPVIAKYKGESETEYFINPSGSFTIGGPHGDTGLTGRKIIVDTYGGKCPHGGGAFSGKDPSKVDRSAAYMARWIAKLIVSAELAKECTIQLSYAIGHDQPLSVHVDTHGTSLHHVDSRLALAVRSVFDLSPKGIINELQLKRPIYSPTAVHGHFGNLDYPWENLETDKLDQLREYFSKDFGGEKRRNEWKKILSSYDAQNLVDSFNREVNSRASASARFEYIILLVDEFKNRGIDVSIITGDNNSIKLNQKVTLVDNALQVIQPDKELEQ